MLLALIITMLGLAAAALLAQRINQNSRIAVGVCVSQQAGRIFHSATTVAAEEPARDTHEAVLPKELASRVDDLARHVEEIERKLRMSDRRAAGMPRQTEGMVGEPSGVARQEMSGAEIAGVENGETSDKIGRSVSELQPKIIKMLNSGYLESVRMLRERLFYNEWECCTKPWALRQGVTEFESYCADNKVELPWDTLNRLRENPNELDVIEDMHLRMKARSVIEQKVWERHQEVWKDCTETARKLSEVASTPGSFAEGLKKLIPLPGFK